MTQNLLRDDENELPRPAPARGRGRRWSLAGVVVVAAIGAAVFAFPKQRDALVSALLSLAHRDAPSATAAAPQPPVVRTALVAAAPGREARFTGVVHARYESALGFRVPGKIVERLVDPGARVRKGEVLMRLDPTDLDLALRAARSDVLAAQAMATQSASEEARQRALVAKNQASWQAYERSKAAADAGAAKLAAARAQERQAENQAAYAELRADADGTIMETSGEPGQVVALGQPVVRLARDGAREAEVYVPEGERAAETGEAALYAVPNAWFPAKLREIATSADPLTRTYRARYTLDGAGRDAALGATVTIRVHRNDAGPPGLAVPAGAVFDDGHGPNVWVVDRARSTVAARAVRLLRTGDEDAIVAGDLAVGERVVALGAHLLEAGERIAIARAPLDTAAR